MPGVSQSLGFWDNTPHSTLNSTKHNRAQFKMLTSSLLILAAAATGLAQTTIPAGYKKVIITSNVNVKFVVVGKTPVKAGTTLVV